MTHARLSLLWTALLVLPGSMVACKGCDDTADKPIPQAPVESRHSRLLSRIADRKLDRTKTYPKDESGAVACGHDAECFVLQAEACVRAKLKHKTTVSGYGTHDVVEANYAIIGSEAGRCQMTRQVTSADSHFDSRLIDMLRKDGKSEADIALLQTDATEKLRAQHPAAYACWFSNDDALEVALDLADGNFNFKLFRAQCNETDPDEAPPPAPNTEQAPAAPEGADNAADQAEKSPTTAKADEAK